MKVKVGDIVRHKKYGVRYMVVDITDKWITLVPVAEDMKNVKEFVKGEEIRLMEDMKLDKDLFEVFVEIRLKFFVFVYDRELDDGVWELCKESDEYIRCAACGIVIRKSQGFIDEDGKCLCMECFMCRYR